MVTVIIALLNIIAIMFCTLAVKEAWDTHHGPMAILATLGLGLNVFAIIFRIALSV